MYIGGYYRYSSLIETELSKLTIVMKSLYVKLYKKM